MSERNRYIQNTRESAAPAPHSPDATNPVQSLLQHPALWRARSLTSLQAASVLPAGHTLLSSLLPAGGWPQGQLIEILVASNGIGELSLLLPLLAAQTQAAQWCACVHAPAPLYASSWQAAGVDSNYLLNVSPPEEKDALWAMEQILRSACVSVTAGWFSRLSLIAMRRLQLACENTAGVAVLFSPASRRPHSSAAALRLYLHADSEGLLIERLKWRGSAPMQLRLPFWAQGLG